jgi:hypothetical protein
VADQRNQAVIRGFDAVASRTDAAVIFIGRGSFAEVGIPTFDQWWRANGIEGMQVCWQMDSDEGSVVILEKMGHFRRFEHADNCDARFCSYFHTCNAALGPRDGLQILPFEYTIHEQEYDTDNKAAEFSDTEPSNDLVIFWKIMHQLRFELFGTVQTKLGKESKVWPAYDKSMYRGSWRNFHAQSGSFLKPDIKEHIS